MLSGWINKGRISVDNNRHTEKAMTTSKLQERDNIGTAWKGERERENKNTFLCAARTAAARLAQEPHWRKKHCRRGRAQAANLQVNGLTLYRLN